jgi:hypothetical protein
LKAIGVVRLGGGEVGAVLSIGEIAAKYQYYHLECLMIRAGEYSITAKIRE